MIRKNNCKIETVYAPNKGIFYLFKGVPTGGLMRQPPKGLQLTCLESTGPPVLVVEGASNRNGNKHSIPGVTVVPGIVVSYIIEPFEFKEQFVNYLWM